MHLPVLVDVVGLHEVAHLNGHVYRYRQEIAIQNKEREPVRCVRVGGGGRAVMRVHDVGAVTVIVTKIRQFIVIDAFPNNINND